jgi:hypothetical protein
MIPHHWALGSVSTQIAGYPRSLRLRSRKVVIKSREVVPDENERCELVLSPALCGESREEGMESLEASMLI